jgi:putative transcriptional regulator
MDPGVSNSGVVMSEEAAFTSLAPGFLIASPPLGDPNFDRTVVLLAVHNSDGALGFVVNRPSPVTVEHLLLQAGYEDVKSKDRVWLGGPVQPESGWIICDDENLDGDDILEVGKRIRVSSSQAGFDALAQQLGPEKTGPPAAKHLVVLGYSGWGPGQLEHEISRGAWLPTPLDEGIVFGVQAEQRWERAYGLLGLNPGHLMSMRTVGEA